MDVEENACIFVFDEEIDNPNVFRKLKKIKQSKKEDWSKLFNSSTIFIQTNKFTK
jgi:hypothetical protein